MEFYIYNDELWCIGDEGENKKVCENDHDLIGRILEVIESCYPDAYRALESIYARSKANLPYYKYLIVRRFCKCNFGELDYHKQDITRSNLINLEHVKCPMRGECLFEGVICLPKFNSNLTGMEMRVMKLLFDGMSNEEISSQLFISPNTVKKHILNSYTKIGVHEKAEFIKYAVQHSLFS